MEKRVLFAAGLSLLVLILWGQLFPSPPAVPEREPTTPIAAEGIDRPVDQAPGVSTPGLPPRSIDPVLPETTEATEAIAAAGEQTLTVETGIHRVELSNRGARALSWQLLEYAEEERPLELFPSFVGNEAEWLAFHLDDATLTGTLGEALFTVDRLSAADGGQIVTFRWADGRGLEATRRLTFRPDSYIVDIEQQVIVDGRERPSRLMLGPGFAAQDRRKGRSQYYYDGRLLWEDGREVERKKRKALKEPGGTSGQLRWAGLEDQFFTALVLPSSGLGELRWRTVELTRLDANAEFDENGDQKSDDARREVLVAISVPTDGAQLYVGPKGFDRLQELGSGLEKAVNWYDWLAGIPRLIHRGLIWLHDRVVANWGVAIVLATVMLRVVLFPLNQFAMVRMKRTQLDMQRVQPELNRIKNRYRKKKDAESRAKMNQEMMQLYRDEGVNPAGGIAGCLPLLLQFPILISFYNMLTVAVELRGAPFALWIQDLSVRDPYWVTPLLMGATMFLQQKMAMSKVKDPQQLQQQRIMMFMPFVFTYFCLQMPSGLVLYWFVNNVLGIGQQWLVNKQTARLEAAHSATGPKAKPKVKPKKA